MDRFCRELLFSIASVIPIELPVLSWTLGFLRGLGATLNQESGDQEVGTKKCECH